MLPDTLPTCIGSLNLHQSTYLKLLLSDFLNLASTHSLTSHRSYVDYDPSSSPSLSRHVLDPSKSPLSQPPRRKAVTMTVLHV